MPSPPQLILKALLLNYSVTTNFLETVIESAGVLSALTLQKESPEVLRELCDDCLRKEGHEGSSTGAGGGTSVVQYLEILSLLLRRKFEIVVFSSSSSLRKEEELAQKSVQKILHPSFTQKTIEKLPIAFMFYRHAGGGKGVWSAKPDLAG